MKRSIFICLLLIISSLLVAITFYWLPIFSGFAAGLAKAAIGIVGFYLTDTYLLHEIDTITELKKNNISYAIFILSLAIVYAACVSTA